MLRNRVRLFAFCLFACLGAAAAAEDKDPFLWLEDVDGAKAMDWVKAENAKTIGTIEADPRFPALHDQALAIAQAKDRIPLPQFRAGLIYNFWQDADHVRGIWRHVSPDHYADPAPDWITALDLDTLAAAEHANWVWKGADCRAPAETRCLIALSDGGEDAVTFREFDLPGAHFVDGGFALPRGKQNVAWIDGDTLAVAREWKKGELTKSGYPYVVKRLTRGQPLGQAVEIFRGTKADVEISPIALDDGDGHHLVLVRQGISFFESRYHLLTPQGMKQLALPLKSDLQGLVAGRLILSLNQDWTAGGTTFAQGTLVSIDAAQLAADPSHPKPIEIFRPAPRQAFDNAVASKNKLLVTYLDNVRGRAAIYSPVDGGGWQARALELPDNIALDVVSADIRSDTAFLDVQGFLTPTTLLRVDLARGETTQIRSLPARFDASGLTVDQKEAVSSDATRIPYFIVHRTDMAPNGQNPTILTAYGGFQVSETPRYSGIVGKLWLERGGVYVLANIRGGGEFGPAWHEAGLKTHRQRIYDDFAAVAKDLIATGVTSPRRLGIEGGSNGGLLMGVEFNQHPDLWNAVDIAVPLLDMIRFEKIAAGASWVGEYGSVSIPAEKRFLESISPYANLRADAKYPEPLIWTTTKDDRVGPQHARKFAARLAAMGHPYFYYEVIEGGHGAGANLKERAHTSTIEYVYFSRKLMD